VCTSSTLLDFYTANLLTCHSIRTRYSNFVRTIYSHCSYSLLLCA